MPSSAPVAALPCCTSLQGIAFIFSWMSPSLQADQGGYSDLLGVIMNLPQLRVEVN
jgi:hypothetical protein